MTLDTLEKITADVVEETIEPEIQDILGGARFSELGGGYEPFAHVSVNGHYIPYRRPRAAVLSHAEIYELSTDNSVRRYLSEIGRIPLLDSGEKEAHLSRYTQAGLAAQRRLEGVTTTEEELEPRVIQELGRIAQQGANARSDFIRANLRLVVWRAKRYGGRGVEMLDLIQEGNIGLDNAVRKYDWRRGTKLATFAIRRIDNELDRAIPTSRLIRTPVNGNEELRNLTKARARLMDVHRAEGRHGQEVAITEQDLAAEMGVSVEKVKQLQDIEERTSLDSINRATSFDGDRSLEHLVADQKASADHEAIEYRSLGRELVAVVRKIITNEREFQVLVRRGFNPQGTRETQAAIAADLGVPKQKIQLFEERAMRRLKDPANAELLAPFRAYL